MILIWYSAEKITNVAEKGMQGILCNWQKNPKKQKTKKKLWKDWAIYPACSKDFPRSDFLWKLISKQNLFI